MSNQISEDQLVSKILEEYTELEKFENREITNKDPEVHYNHYGDRGVVDLVIESKSLTENSNYNEITVIEAKARLSSANKVVRQCKRHSSYFFKGSNYNPAKYTKNSFELWILLTQENWDFVMENIQYFSSLENKGWEIFWFEDKGVTGASAALNIDFPTSKFESRLDYLEKYHTDSLYKYEKKRLGDNNL